LPFLGSTQPRYTVLQHYIVLMPMQGTHQHIAPIKQFLCAGRTLDTELSEATHLRPIPSRAIVRLPRTNSIFSFFLSRIASICDTSRPFPSSSLQFSLTTPYVQDYEKKTGTWIIVSLGNSNHCMRFGGFHLHCSSRTSTGLSISTTLDEGIGLVRLNLLNTSLCSQCIFISHSHLQKQSLLESLSYSRYVSSNPNHISL